MYACNKRKEMSIAPEQILIRMHWRYADASVQSAAARDGRSTEFVRLLLCHHQRTTVDDFMHAMRTSVMHTFEG